MSKDIVKSFWGLNTDKNGNVKAIISLLELRNFLIDAGFRQIKENGRYVLRKNNIVQLVTPKDIEQHVINYVESDKELKLTQKQRNAVLETILQSNTRIFNPDKLSFLKPLEFDFVKDTKSKCYRFYKNAFFEITTDAIIQKEYSELQGFIWKSQIIDREIEYSFESESVFEQFIMNVCDRHSEKFNYLKRCIGYLMHDFFEGTLKAITLTDANLESGANGRSGKTLLNRAIAKIVKLTELNGKDFNPTNKHKYQEVTLDSKVICINDLIKGFQLESLFNDITEGIRIEEKNKSPLIHRVKFLLITNTTIRLDGGSAKDRILEIAFSNYYNLNHRPKDDFGHWFFSEWNEQQWNEFDNFMLTCVQDYLKNPEFEKLKNPVLDKKKLIEQTSPEFADFVEHHLIKLKKLNSGEPIAKSDILISFKHHYPEIESDNRFNKTHTLTKWLKEWCLIYGYHFENRLGTKKDEFSIRKKSK